MPLYGTLARKPLLGTPINLAHPLARGLKFFCALNEGTGLTVYDIGSSGITLAVHSGTTWGGAAMGGLSCAANNAGASVTAPALLQLTGPFTIATGFRQLGLPTTNGCPVTACTFNTAFTTPFYGYAFSYSSAGTGLNFVFNQGGSLFQTSFTPVVTGTDYVLSASYTSGSQIFYSNGAQAATLAQSGFPSYGSGPVYMIGAPPPIGKNANSLIYWTAIWDGFFPASWHAQLGDDVNAIWRMFPSISTSFLAGGITPPPSPTAALAIDPSYVTRARAASPVAAGAGTTVISKRPGRLVQVLTTAAGTGSGGVVFYDSASGASGNVLGYLPATVGAATMFPFDMPVRNGIVVANPANGPALTVAWR